jgi:hypothetical protein
MGLGNRRDVVGAGLDPDEFDDAPDDDTEAGHDFTALPDLGKRIRPEPFTNPGKRGPAQGVGHNAASRLSGQTEGLHLNFAGTYAPAPGPNLVTTFGGGPIGSSVNENPGRAVVRVQDNAAASASTDGPPAVRGMRGAARSDDRIAPDSASPQGTGQNPRFPECQPPPACR